MKRIILSALFIGTLIFGINSSGVFAQRAAVSGKEVTGTFRYGFTGKFKDNASVIKILALGGNRLKISFDLTYPYIDGTGAPSANVGYAEGIADINGDTAIYRTGEGDERCEIQIKFVKPGQIEVTQEQMGIGCGFGFNVSAQGTYKKVSNAKPRFESPE